MNEDERSPKLRASNEELMVFVIRVVWTSRILVVHPDQSIFDDNYLEHDHHCSAVPDI